MTHATTRMAIALFASALRQRALARRQPGGPGVAAPAPRSLGGAVGLAGTSPPAGAACAVPPDPRSRGLGRPA